MTCNIFQVVTQAVNEGVNDRGKPLVDGHTILDKKYFTLFNDDYSRRIKEKYGISSQENVFTTKPIETKAGRPDVYGYSKTYQENRWFFNEPLLKELEKKMIEFETADRLKKEKLEKVVALAQDLASIAAFSLKSMDTVEEALSEIADQLKASPSEAVTARNSVGNDIADIALELFPQIASDSTIKPGVPELFESNPELANAVYEALGFKEYSKETKSKLALTERLKDLFKDKSTVLFTAGDNTDAFYIDLVKTSDDRYFYFSEGQSPEEISKERFTKEIEFIDGQVATTEEKDVFINNYLKIADLDQISENPLLTKEEKLEATKDILKKITAEQKQQAQQLYSQYLDTIFPNSKVKDIVYHGTKTKDEFEKFITEREYPIQLPQFKGKISKGSFFTKDKSIADVAGIRTITAILNMENPLYRNKGSEYLFKEDVEDIQKNNDSLIAPGNKEEFIVFEPEQIHRLGTKQDIEGFRAFAQGTSEATETNVDIQEALQDFRDENSNMPDEDIDDYFFSCEI